MDARLQWRVQRYGWDKAADFYDKTWQAQLWPAQSRMIEAVAPRPGERVLDVACGTGIVSRRIAAMVGASGWVPGTDISAAMVAHATAAADGNLVFRRMDAEALELSDGAFDVVVSQRPGYDLEILLIDPESAGINGRRVLA
jgi:ubiquinone/menaquinone biosynthesis C-methylase UbiE